MYKVGGSVPAAPAMARGNNRHARRKAHMRTNQYANGRRYWIPGLTNKYLLPLALMCTSIPVINKFAMCFISKPLVILAAGPPSPYHNLGDDPLEI